MDAKRACDLHDLEDLLLRRAVADRVLDVQTEAWRVEVRGCHVEGRVDELLDLRLERAAYPRHRRVERVGLEEVSVEQQDLVPELVPVAALLGEVGLERLLAFGEL